MNLRKSDIVITVIFLGFLAFGNIYGGGAMAAAGQSDGNSWLASAASAFQQRYQGTLDAIARQFGFGNLVSFTVGRYTYNQSETGMNAVYADPQGNTLTIELCVNGAYFATEVTACQSGPNSCGMRGSGFVTRIISNERQLGSSVSACSAKVPPDSLCSGVVGGGVCSNGATDYPTCTQTTSCTPAYTCSGNTIQYQAADCSTYVTATCDATQQCVAGSSTCVARAIGFLSSTSTSDGTGGQGGLTLDGHLLASPKLVHKGDTTHLYWDVGNAKNCSLSDGTLTLSTALTAGTAGLVTPPIQQQTTYTLFCNGFSGASPASINETQTVNLIPAYQEQ